jgi:hypothetical protein
MFQRYSKERSDCGIALVKSDSRDAMSGGVAEVGRDVAFAIFDGACMELVEYGPQPVLERSTGRRACGPGPPCSTSSERGTSEPCRDRGLLGVAVVPSTSSGDWEPTFSLACEVHKCSKKLAGALGTLDVCPSCPSLISDDSRADRARGLLMN